MVRNTLFSVISPGELLDVFGRFTPMEGSEMKRAVTMKMISKTSVTSTKGVTLIPVMASSSESNSSMRTRFLFALQINKKNLRGGLHLRDKFLYTSLKVVVCDDRGDRNQQTNGCSHQCFGYSGHHNGRIRALSNGKIMKCLDDSKHRTEQPDKRSIVAQRAKDYQHTFHLELFGYPFSDQDFFNSLRTFVYALKSRKQDTC